MHYSRYRGSFHSSSACIALAALSFPPRFDAASGPPPPFRHPTPDLTSTAALKFDQHLKFSALLPYCRCMLVTCGFCFILYACISYAGCAAGLAG